MLSPLPKHSSMSGPPGSSNPSTPVAREKGKSGIAISPTDNLPPELLAHIFALLPAGSLLSATLVCRRWHHISQDESSWKAAFANYYSVPASGFVPGRRLDNASWRNEYLWRTRWNRRWTRSRTAAVAYNAHTGPITDLVVSLTDAMAISMTESAASRSDPRTGRILRTNIHPGAAPGQIACAKASEKGQAIAWGGRDGSVTVSLVCAPVSRPLALVHMGTDESMHTGPVTGISFAPYTGATTPSKCTFATTATDGIVKVWDAEAPDVEHACVFTSSPFERMRRVNGDIDVGSCISYAPSYRVVAVGTESGSMHIWRLDGQWVTKAYVCVPPPVERIAPIDITHIDASASLTHTSVLIKRKGASCFERHWPFAEPARSYITFQPEGKVALTALAADLAPPKSIGKDVVSGFGSFKFVATGDDEGNVALWMWDALEAGVPTKTAGPAKLLQAKSGGLPTVTALALSDLFVLAGSIDGSIKAYDALTGQLVRALADRSNPRQAIRALAAGLGMPEERQQYAISHLRASRGALVAAAGDKIIAWHVDDANSKSKKRKVRYPSAARNNMSRMERLSSDREMQRDVEEIREQLRDEQDARLERAAQSARLRDLNGDGALRLSEDEAIAYAMMLSAEEADAAHALADDMAALSFDFEEPAVARPDEDDTAVLTPARSSLFSSSMRSSASSRSSTATLSDFGDLEEETEEQCESFVGSPASISSNRYFPLSPRVRPQALPDLTDDMSWPSPRSPLLSPVHAAARRSPVPTPSPSSRRSFSDAARTGLGASLESPRSLNFSSTTLASPSLRPQRHPQTEDADIQFAIELSLAEARQRRDGN